MCKNGFVRVGSGEVIMELMFSFIMFSFIFWTIVDFLFKMSLVDYRIKEDIFKVKNL